MNYYEELGMTQDATTADVREAYKLAARSLHPDWQRDQRLKDLAECQMRRLSDVVAMLVSPRKRAMYRLALAKIGATSAEEARFAGQWLYVADLGEDARAGMAVLVRLNP